MNLFKRFLSDRFNAPPPVRLDKPTIFNSETLPVDYVRVDIVGEGSYQTELGLVAGRPKTEDSVSIWRSAALIPEPDNEFDPNAVMVVIENKTVGYLDRAQAVLFHEMMVDAEMKGDQLTDITAEVRGGWRRDGLSAAYGVALYFPAVIAAKLTKPKRNYRPRAQVRDFLDLTEAEACMICEAVGAGMTKDSRLTATEKLIDALEFEWAKGGLLLDYWESRDLPDVEALIEKLRPLTPTQARAVVSAANRVWRAQEREDEYDDVRAMRESGLIA